MINLLMGSMGNSTATNFLRRPVNFGGATPVGGALGSLPPVAPRPPIFRSPGNLLPPLAPHLPFGPGGGPTPPLAPYRPITGRTWGPPPINGYPWGGFR